MQYNANNQHHKMKWNEMKQNKTGDSNLHNCPSRKHTQTHTHTNNTVQLAHVRGLCPDDELRFRFQIPTRTFRVVL